MQLRVPKLGAEYLPFFEDLEMIGTDAGCSVSRFAELVGVPRRTYHARLARLRAGNPPKGPWPAPVVDRLAWIHRCGEVVGVGASTRKAS